MDSDVASDGTLTQQVRKTIPLYGAGAVGLALDTKSQCLFVSYKTSNVIAVLDATTLNSVGTATAKGAHDMAGIVYDSDKGLLYCAAHGTDSLYIFQWKPATNELIPGIEFSRLVGGGPGVWNCLG